MEELPKTNETIQDQDPESLKDGISVLSYGEKGLQAAVRMPDGNIYYPDGRPLGNDPHPMNKDGSDTK